MVLGAISRWMLRAHWWVRGRLEVGIDDRVGCGGECRGLKQRAGLRRWGDCSAGQIGQASAALAEIGIDGGERGARQIGQDGGGDDEVIDAVVGDAVVAADGGLAGAEGIPREAERGSEIAQLILEELAGNPGHGVAGGRAGDHRLVGNADVVVGRVGREADLVAQAEIDGEVGRELPGVLRVEFVFGIAGIEEEGALGPLSRPGRRSRGRSGRRGRAGN